jgi:hypothetical protein
MNEEQTSALYSIMLRTRETGLREKQLMKEVRRLHRLELALTLYRYIRRFYTAHAEGSATGDTVASQKERVALPKPCVRSSGVFELQVAAA